MCKIIITETGRSRKSRAESFACPHPTPLPLPLPLPRALALPPPPPPPQPSATVKLAPPTASQHTTEQERGAQEKGARDQNLQKLAVHPPKTIPHAQSAKPNAPNKTVHIPYLYARTPKTLPQVNAPGKTQAQHKGTLKPVTKESDKEKTAPSKSGKREKASAADDGGGRRDGSKQAMSRRDTSTRQNRLPEPVTVTNPDRDESETSAEKMWETATDSPSRNVRFAIGESRRTLSTTSSSSTSSHDSFIDPHPHNIHTTPHSMGKKSEPTPSSRNMPPSYFANMEDPDAMESDDSSNIDAGETFASRVPWDDAESFRDLGPAKSQPHDMRPDRSIRGGRAASSIPRAARRHHVSAPVQSPMRPSYQLMPEQEREPMSDQESAIDSGGPHQTPMTAHHLKNRDGMWPQSSDEQRGFDAWLKSLVASQQERASSRSSPPKSFKEPIFVYRTKSKPSAKTGKEPLLAIKKIPRSDSSHHTYKGGHSQSETKPVEELETTRETRNPSDRPPSAVGVAEQPVYYNPGLQMFWRDV